MAANFVGDACSQELLEELAQALKEGYRGVRPRVGHINFAGL